MKVSEAEASFCYVTDGLTDGWLHQSAGREVVNFDLLQVTFHQVKLRKFSLNLPAGEKLGHLNNSAAETCVCEFVCVCVLLCVCVRSLSWDAS